MIKTTVHTIPEALQKHLSYPDIVIRPPVLKIVVHLAIILTHVRRIPAVAPRHPGGERRRLPLERRVAAAHDTLAEVLEAVGQVPGRLLRDPVRVVGRHAGIRLYDGVEAVELVRHGRGEDRRGVAF